MTALSVSLCKARRTPGRDLALPFGNSWEAVNVETGSYKISTNKKYWDNWESLNEPHNDEYCI